MKVSVIIPCYNVEDYINDCLNSVKNQAFENLEVICVDDGSTDYTLSILRGLQKDSSLSFKLIEQKNKGASAARNAGLKIANGNFIQFLDADDLLDKEKIAHQIRLIQESDDDFSFVVGACKKISHNGDLITEFIPDPSSNKWVSLMRTKLGNTVSNLYNTNTLNKIGGWDETLQSSQEANLMFRLLKENDRIIYDTRLLTTIRSRESGSISLKDPKGNWQRYAILREQIFLYVFQNNSAPKSEVQAAFFDTIHILYPYDKNLALELYRKHLKGKFKLKPTEVVSEVFAFVVRLFGFRFSETLRSLNR